MSLKRFFIIFFIGVFIFHLIFILISTAYVFYLKYNNPKTTPIMEFRKREFGLNSIKNRFVPLNMIPKSVVKAVLIAEDCNFYRHFGIDFESISLAFKKNLSMGRISYYGGSTISQQVARTMMLLPTKSFLRKYLEFFITLEMELILGKDRIMELYLNYAEWGKGVFGINSASKYFFKRSIYNLTFEEVARLVAILPNPRKYTPFSVSKLVETRVELIKKYYNN
ncbi:MAG: monofunctional biosynthetic peptidoglycan transglycosylase [Brevinematia bacterium]